MSIIGFNFTKINVEKTGNPSGKINISNNVGVTDLSNAKISFSGTQSAGLKFTFSYNSKYEPKVGKIEFEGDVVYMADATTVEETLKNWDKDKSIPPKMMETVVNYILNKCNVEALILSRDINLPSPIQLPKMKVDVKTGGKKNAN